MGGTENPDDYSKLDPNVSNIPPMTEPAGEETPSYPEPPRDQWSPRHYTFAIGSSNMSGSQLGARVGIGQGFNGPNRHDGDGSHISGPFYNPHGQYYPDYTQYGHQARPNSSSNTESSMSFPPPGDAPQYLSPFEQFWGFQPMRAPDTMNPSSYSDINAVNNDNNSRETLQKKHSINTLIFGTAMAERKTLRSASRGGNPKRMTTIFTM